MKITFDKIANAGYIKISNNKINKTVSVSDYCNVDIDKDGGVVGIELLFVNQYENDFKFWLGLSSAAVYKKGNCPHTKLEENTYLSKRN